MRADSLQSNLPPVTSQSSNSFLLCTVSLKKQYFCFPNKYTIRVPFSYFIIIYFFLSVCVHTTHSLHFVLDTMSNTYRPDCVQITGFLNLSHQVYFDTFFYNQLFKYIFCQKKKTINTFCQKNNSINTSSLLIFTTSLTYHLTFSFHLFGILTFKHFFPKQVIFLIEIILGQILHNS
jgi:hypothetical protein